MGGRTAASRRARWRYWFDGWMSRGTKAIMALLALATVVFVVVLGTIAWLVAKFVDPGSMAPDPGDSPWDYLWNALMRTLDAGTMGGDQGWWFRLLMLLVTIGGIVIVASLIGIVSGAFDAKVAELRQGRSTVLEHDHTLILGWNSKVLTIVSELVTANESRGRTAIVIVADQDKVDMEDAIHAAVPRFGRTKLVCRTGDVKSPHDIAIGSPQSARSIILLAPDGVDDPDADVIKTALALTSGPNRSDVVYQIVGELKNEANLGVAQLAGGDEVEWILNSDFIGRVIVQSCRQSGLAIVYQELLSFSGNECYFTAQPTLAGSTYFQAQLAFPDSTVIGIASGDDVRVNPPADTVIGTDDELVVIAQDDSTIRLGTPAVVDATGVSVRQAAPRKPEHTVILGANRHLPNMLSELDEYAVAGSTVDIVTRAKVPKLPAFERLTVTVSPSDQTHRDVLETLALTADDHIIVLPETDRFAPDVADNRTLITLLLLRDLELRQQVKFSVVTEMLDDTNRELAEVTEADDFIVSDKLIACALAQISEARRFKALYDELFAASGSEIYLHPAMDYVAPGVDVDFTTVHEAARRRGETAIGYRLNEHAHQPDANYGVRVNPPKTERRSFGPGDSIIVLAET